MSDSTERGGAMAAVYRQMKTKGNGFMRIDKAKVLAESKKSATLKGDGRNKPMANVQGGNQKSPLKKS